MSIEDRAKATAKDVSGKVEEAVGDLTGNKEAKAKGKSKQAEAKIDHTVEDGKEAVKKTID
ncbi:MAG: CsbD family protein [Phormidium sp. GEM2.Bin31]|nr:CsbD family protein [Phormidium sp. BM_Day4_Bin.17]TVR14838.1 MAG: CsbD family protein [Phormidium sp. GEM2.Bin31]UCJ13347.1 MAG: CsbD family protein [Phormidium sp. PBR-2020]